MTPTPADDVALPELPEPAITSSQIDSVMRRTEVLSFSSSQMHAYARAAIAADRAKRTGLMDEQMLSVFPPGVFGPTHILAAIVRNVEAAHGITPPAPTQTQPPDSANRPGPGWYAAKIRETLDDDFSIGPALLPCTATTFRHVKTGGLYELVAHATQESDLAPMVIYRSLAADGRVWVRPSAEFYDGRFETVPTQTPPAQTQENKG